MALFSFGNYCFLNALVRVFTNQQAYGNASFMKTRTEAEGKFIENNDESHGIIIEWWATARVALQSGMHFHPHIRTSTTPLPYRGAFVI